METLILKPGREKSLLRRHPWIFSGAIKSVTGQLEPGETVKVVTSNGDYIGQCCFNPESSISGRMWTFDNEVINREFFLSKMRIAIILRNNLSLLNSLNTACRIIHAESDGLPGLIVDQYGEYLVVQYLTAGIEKWKTDIISGLIELTGISNIYERSDVDVRKLEGLSERKGLLNGEEPLEKIEILEGGNRFLVDIKNGQKTGFYLDQRENRIKLAEFAKDKSVLNCFCYTGGFTVYALREGAKSVLSIDSSDDAIEIAKENIRINNLDSTRAEWITGDVFKELRLLRDRGVKFDVIVLDPPKFASTSAQVNSAARGYKDINLLAFKLLNPGGTLFTFSCSGGVSQELFQKIVADAALDAGINASIIGYLSQGPDHPIALNFPEGEYLKGLICKT
ncbi:MAG: class I SAM-dependent rRNA methyltransferase [Pelolinea sp.]|nr:class I SAM-dependent rRNA methyltransferase [Pelolinea sp.]